MSWISEKTGFVHQAVPQGLIDAAVEKALTAIDEDQMGWVIIVGLIKHSLLLLHTSITILPSLHILLTDI